MPHSQASNMHPRSVHIAYADEETLLRKTVVTHVLGIAEGFHVIFDTADCAEMLVRIVNWELRPDICIMGAGYTDYQVFGEASKKNPSIKFLVFTKAFHISILVTMIWLGAKGFVTKHAEPEELIQAISEMLGNKYFFSSDIIEMHPAISKEIKNRLSKKQLNDSELVLLQWLTTDLTLPEIAARVHLSPRTIEHHCKRLKTKLGVQSRVGLALVAASSGMTFIKCNTK